PPRRSSGAKGLERDGPRRLLVGPLGHVALDCDRAVATAELLRELLELVDRASREHEPPAVLRKLARRGGADTGRGAGEEEDPVVAAHARDSIVAVHTL